MKHRSLIYFNIDAVDYYDESKEGGNNEIRDAVKDKRFDSFEHMYGQVTEKLVARVIENE